MKKIIKILVGLAICAGIIASRSAQARDVSQIADWYIKDFQSTITVNADSSLFIEEKIIADCGNLPDKHGIFRILPTQIKTERETIKTPVELVSITDFNQKPINYSESKDSFNHTIIWKIGDPDITVSGENYYKITYLVKNAIRSQNNNFDELYWNLSGNFWDIDIDNFRTDIIFPQGINKNNSEVYLYSGNAGDRNNALANYEWTNNNTLRVASNKTLPPKHGITASISFPKNIITPYQPGFFELYGDHFWFLIPVLTFIVCFAVWNKYGKDPRVDKTIVPEFEIPENLTPMEMGSLIENGTFNDKLITATIIDLAVKKYIVIEEIAKKGIFGQQDFRLKRIWGNEYPALSNPEELLLKKIFGASQEILLSKLKNEFYKELPEIKKSAINSLKEKNLIYQSGLHLKTSLLALAMVLVFIGIILFGTENLSAVFSFILSAITAAIFGILMPKRTQKGAELNWRIKGFKLYMKTAEKYRAQFYEKENIFEKFLPYAIIFGIAKLWAKKMEEIYGKEYFANYHPVWYAGNFAAGFNTNSLASQMNSISAGIAANMGFSSGAHGAGGTGGGGGGGGGGGW
jgi:uncharacterized membrane protein